MPWFNRIETFFLRVCKLSFGWNWTLPLLFLDPSSTGKSSIDQTDHPTVQFLFEEPFSFTYNPSTINNDPKNKKTSTIKTSRSYQSRLNGRTIKPNMGFNAPLAPLEIFSNGVNEPPGWKVEDFLTGFTFLSISQPWRCTEPVGQYSVM